MTHCQTALDINPAGKTKQLILPANSLIIIDEPPCRYDVTRNDKCYTRLICLPQPKTRELALGRIIGKFGGWTDVEKVR
jgi:hypothetical protein